MKCFAASATPPSSGSSYEAVQVRLDRFLRRSLTSSDRDESFDVHPAKTIFIISVSSVCCSVQYDVSLVSRGDNAVIDVLSIVVRYRPVWSDVGEEIAEERTVLPRKPTKPLSSQYIPEGHRPSILRKFNGRSEQESVA